MLRERDGERELFLTHCDRLGSVVAVTTAQGEIIERYAYSPWGMRVDPDDWSSPDERTAFWNNRGYTGHEHLDAFRLIDMNGRMYDPLTCMFLSPDPQLQDPYRWLNYNRYAYCYGNPNMYTDPSGEFVIEAIAFGLGNALIHNSRGDVSSSRDAARYFWQGTLSFLLAPASSTVSMGMNLAGAIVGTVSGVVQGIANGNWATLRNAWKIFGGGFYLDENRSFWGGVWQGISRRTWELPQTFAGDTFTQWRNAVGYVDRVDYFGGATFATKENQAREYGVTLGNYINISLRPESTIRGSFDDRMIDDPLFMHEYGHTFDSQKFGMSYLFAIGLPSLVSCATEKDVPGEPYGVMTHEFRWFEMSANNNASKYFGKHFGVDWNAEYYKEPWIIETFYPRSKR